MLRRTVAALLITGLLAACDFPAGKYEIVRAGNQTFLLNRGTGDTRIIDGTALVPVKAPDFPLDRYLADKAKSWAPQTIPQLENIKLTIRTKYRDGKMLYSIEASPFAGRLEREFTVKLPDSDYLRKPTILLDLYDSEGFRTGEAIELRIRGATRIVNEKGEPQALSWTGDQVMTLETYQAAVSQSIRWSGFLEK